MKVRLIFKRHSTAQYSEDDYVMKTECKTVVVNLPRVGEWQIVGYEEVTE